MNARIRIRNTAEVARKIEALARAGGDNLISGMRVVGETIMTDVKASRPGSGVPVDTGALRASGRVSGPDSGGTVTLSFGGAAAPYGLRQHEELNYRHPVGEARYLIRGLERFEAGRGPQEALREVADAAIRKARNA
jgi:hypothetical protein